MIIGTYDHYAINGIWKELISIGPEKIDIKSKEIYINGQFNQPIIRKKISENENSKLF